MEAFAIATVLHRLSTGKGPKDGMTGTPALPFRLAQRIATNRTVARVHFPMDSLAGAWVGCCVGELIHAFAKGGGISETDKVARKDLDQPKLAWNEMEEAWKQTDDFLISFFLPHFETQAKELDPLSEIEVAEEIWHRAAAEWPGTPAA